MCYQTLIICPCTSCATKLAEASPNEPDPRSATESWWFCKRLSPEVLSKTKKSYGKTFDAKILGDHPYKENISLGKLVGKDYDENKLAFECEGSGEWYTSDSKAKGKGE